MLRLLIVFPIALMACFSWFGNAFGIGGSSVTSGGDLNVAAQSVQILGAATASAHDSQSSSQGMFQGSSAGFLSLFGGSSNASALDRIANNASVLNAGGTLNVTAASDLNVVGSKLSGGNR